MNTLLKKFIEPKLSEMKIILGNHGIDDEKDQHLIIQELIEVLAK